LNRRSTPAAAAKQFLFAAGAGLAISGARSVRPLTQGPLLTTGAQTQPPPPVTPSLDDARRIRHLMFYFAMVFVVEGIRPGRKPVPTRRVLEAASRR
jgi:hypothetical protein